MKFKNTLLPLLFVFLTGCANDAQIMKTLSHDIEAYQGLGNHQIAVESEGGVVTLEGYVVSDVKRTDIGRIASRTEGVKEVKNKLEVRKSLDFDVAKVCDRVLERISKGQTINAECDGSTVTILGTVESDDVAEKVGHIAQGTPGVNTVINLLITPAPPSDKVIDQRVRRAIVMINEYNLSYYVRSGVVYFSGYVKTADELESVLSVARKVKGVRGVKSDVQVGGKANL